MQASSVARVKVEPGGEGVVAHVGLHALGVFADRLGLGDLLSAAVPVRGERLPVHDRGKMMLHAALAIAAGGEACSDIEALRAQPDLFGAVASDSTLKRVIPEEITPEVRSAMIEAIGQARAAVWEQAGLIKGKRPVFLDIDATLTEVHSENKEGAAPTYKKGFGFHPLLSFADGIGDALSGMLRPGNAGSNTAEDHITVLDEAIAALPEDIQAGHHPGDDPALVRRKLVARTDSAGSTHDFVAGMRARNVGFMTVAATTAQIQSAIFKAESTPGVWKPARRQNGKRRKRSAVAELTGLVDLSAWPAGTRLIVRREPLHPGAQRSLFPSTDYRYWGFYTDQKGSPVTLDVTMRAHAHVENHIERLKDSGLGHFPFPELEANRTWMTLVLLAADLVRWFQVLCLSGYWRNARPKALRWGIFHAPGRLVRCARQHIVRILDGWPFADALIGAYRNIEAIT
jgi:hypothetical protein